MKVNMTPNPLDVVTIHASQGDTEARQWEFELHNNGELIDTSEVTEQMFFKAYKGGTEEILPTNGSVPVTAPFLGDIRYPQGLLTDQEFLYRESPTESDGLAKITDIKGNTLVWNQLVQNGNFGSTDGWTPTSTTTFTVSENVGSVTWNGTGTFARIQQVIPRYANHKYLAICDIKLSNADDDVIPISMYNGTELVNSVKADSVNWKTYFLLFTQLSDSDSVTSRTRFCQMGNASTAEIRNAMLFDLTVMGLDITSADEFDSLFSNPYYDYNTGTLLSFNGTGLKTGGENLIDFSTLQIGKNWWKGSAVDRAIIEFPVEENKEYTISFDYSSNVLNSVIIYRTGWNSGQITNINIGTSKEYTFTTPSTCRVVCIQFNARVNGFVLSMSDFYGFWNCALTDTFSTKALPVSTYFPTGMKSAGNVYDELTPTKAITRIGAVDLGSLNWQYRTTGSTYAPYFYASFTGIKPNGNPNVRKANILCSKYSTAYRGQDIFIDKTICADGSSTELTQLQIKDSSYTDTTAFKNSLQDVYLYYELATPTETSFTTASLVTENAEIPLSNEDGVLIGKCTEQLSENPGFFDGKIKLADGDGECYSNKIQLHIERSPQ